MQHLLSHLNNLRELPSRITFFKTLQVGIGSKILFRPVCSNIITGCMGVFLINLSQGCILQKNPLLTLVSKFGMLYLSHSVRQINIVLQHVARSYLSIAWWLVMIMLISPKYCKQFQGLNVIRQFCFCFQQFLPILIAIIYAIKINWYTTYIFINQLKATYLE
jgi:hypothetical protein